ncbi:MAG: PDZ domain-containing protein, partial [Oscillospiraceae bacterium]|nr:PDZ domain-containing protein [Oscillospiraceae bacterium]
MAVIIKDVVAGSLAQKAGIKPLDMLISINGNDIEDILDYQFYLTEKKLILVITNQDGKPSRVKIKKQQYDDIGLLFETYLMDKKHTCKNKCIFCFVDQMPPDMRDTLYFKDDDSRLSFLFGNYTTLTNMPERDV